MFKENLKNLLTKYGTVELVLYDDELNLYAMTLCKECQCDVIRELGIRGTGVENLKDIVYSLGYDFISLKEYYEKGTYDEYGNKMTCCCNDSSYKVVRVNFNKDNEDDYYMAWATV
ncbi:hypothetical protein [Clostridium perfringens]|uniref:hypothetical protein n=1 Tax=Clostridium perfringens TaxID=1502 RepID=UPI000B3AA0F5|nr:hypothetical protein [Clostridium perfringens]EHK2401097.1 hypothetical protein [Clostridium perfringens]MBO3328608.1 hypothetical protein [Clostridium perfringens]MDK0631302.1 hypothetical protein [Clostridium perfringens]MDK0785583.1 hypothetical protein [Clostridium perfringens]MDK0847041.1 hypothetical protein [Clostridium perfringens]